MKSVTRRFFLILTAVSLGLTVLAGPMSRYVEAQQLPLTFTEPYLLTLNPEKEMNICWITSESVLEAYVEYGLTPAYGSRIDAKEYPIVGLKKSASINGYDPDPSKNPDLDAFQQIAKIEGLRQNQKYFYRVVTRPRGSGRLKIGEGYYFKTAPDAEDRHGKPVQFALLSDLQQKPQILHTVKMIGRSQPDLIIYSGDLQNTPWKASEWFQIPGVYTNPAESGKEWFTAMQQTADDCRLLQYIPIFPSPGNHELTDQRVLTDPVKAVDKNLWDLSIYMQIFRPLYPEQQYGEGGKHWYSVDYGDMHIVSISAFRWHPWDAYKAPGWLIFDSLKPGSAQYDWLAKDLASARSRYIWVTMHWHMLNRGTDGQVPFSPPSVNAGIAAYPEPDYCYEYLKPLFEHYRVNGVSFGHSHVYERYLVNGVNYIEAASIGNNYRAASDPYHPSGNKPVIEENRFRSFMLLGFGPSETLRGIGVQASGENDGFGYVGRVFDDFDLVSKKHN